MSDERQILLCEPCIHSAYAPDQTVDADELEALELVPLSFGGVTNYICPRCGEVRGQDMADCSQWAHD